MEDVLTTPLGFIEGVLGLHLYDWQAKAVTALAHAVGPKGEITQIAVASPNEGGKSSRIVAGAALWWITVHKKGKCVITTKDGKQLTGQITPAIKEHLSKFEGYAYVESPYFKVTTPHGATIVAFTTDEPGRAEGWHSDGVDAPLLCIIDEAKSVNEPIFQGIDRCGYKAKMLVSSPGEMQGSFYNAFTKNRAQYICVQAGLLDCPHIPKEKIERVISTYGENAPYTRSVLHGEFMAEDLENTYAVSITNLERALRNPPKWTPGMRVAFCDFGGGTSEHVIALREGNRISLLACWREANKEAAANRFVREFKKAGLEPSQCYCDASDKEIWELLVSNGWTINRQNFGSPANEPEDFISWGAESWIKAGIQIGKCEVILPEDDTLKSQLTTRRIGKPGSRGRMTIEDKYEMAKRNLPSPDRADAVVGALAVYDSSYFQKDPFKIPAGIFTKGLYEDSEQSELVEQLGGCVGL
jgi:hypothetical protein